MRPTRRQFLGGIAAGALTGPILGKLPGVSIARRAVGPGAFRLGRISDVGDVDELVQWIVDVRRERATSEAIDRVKAGLAPEPFLAALFLAGVHEIEPRPMGFKFHCVMQMASIAAVVQALDQKERALPLIYALDFFKASQARQVDGSEWHLPEVVEPSLPEPKKAKRELDTAMETFDVAKADAAVTSLARHVPRDALIAALAPWSLRSFGSAGHAPIYAANAFRTLDVVGWSHAEPVVRSLVRGLLALERGAAMQSFARAKEIALKGPAGDATAEAPSSPLAALRAANGDEAQDLMVTLELATKSSRSGWLACVQYALELLARTPSLFAVHATTGVEAIQWLAGAVDDRAFQRFAQLQAAAWLIGWREAFARGNTPREVDFTQLVEPAAAAASSSATAAIQALDALGDDRWRTARAIVDGLREPRARAAFLARARALLVNKGHEAHDWKFFAALESLARVHDELAAPLLACGVHYLRDGVDADFGPVATARAALLGV